MGTLKDIFVLTASLLVLSNTFADAQWSSPLALYGWNCAPGQFCQKVPLTAATRAQAVGLNTCQLTCSQYLNVWPRPSSVQLTNPTLRSVDVNAILFRTARGLMTATMYTAADKLRSDVKARTKMPRPLLCLTCSTVTVVLDIADNSQTRLQLTTDESYTLTVTTSGILSQVTATIKANNYFGARNGMETLSQLMVFDPIQNQVNIPRALTITDAPKYPVRGVMLDTARSYISVPVIKRTLDGMAASKLNTFHWHITDSHSFPFASKTRPEMTRIGAYSEDKIYTPSDIADIVEYGRIRGIRIIPEYDAPAHVGEGWQNFPDGLVACYQAKPWYNFCSEPPCGQIDPTKAEVYNVLSDIYKDLAEVFPMDLFHMGGDEVNIPCWQSVPSIGAWAIANGYANATDGTADYIALWEYFQRTALAKFDEQTAPKQVPIILWTSHLTFPENLHYLDVNRYIIQIWTTAADPNIKAILDRGHKIIISNYDAMYLDCGVSAWTRAGTNWCSPYKGWQQIYDNKPELIAGDKVSQVYGSITPLWTEQSDDATVDARFWPRAAANAERLWSDPAEDFKSAVTRMLTHRERLVAIGLRPELLQPAWCYNHEANCPVDGMYNV